jgi:hypothetical protein
MRRRFLSHFRRNLNQGLDSGNDVFLSERDGLFHGVMRIAATEAIARGTMFLLSFTNFADAISVSDDRLKLPLLYVTVTFAVFVLLFSGATTTFAVSDLFLSATAATFAPPPHVSFQAPLDVLPHFQQHLPSSSS